LETLQKLENKWFLVFLTTLCWAIAATFATGYFSFQYNDLLNRAKGRPVYVNVELNYGNGTIEWHNNTETVMGTTLLNVTILVSDVNYTVWSGLGALVNGLNHVQNAYPFYWMWWMWTSYSGWVEGPVGCDKYVVADNETLCWFYENTTISPLPSP
jgi:hypothetical protein